MTRTVVCFTDSDSFAGAEQALLTLLGGLDRRRWTPILAHHDQAGLAPLTRGARMLGIESRTVPAMPHGREGLRRILPFAIWLRRQRPVVFHAHLPWPLAAKQALLASILARVPAIVATLQLHMDVPMTWPMRTQQRLIGRGVDRFIVVSEEMRRCAPTLLPWPPEKMEVVRNAVDAHALRRPHDPGLRRRLVGAAERPLVLVPARLDSQKGHVHLFTAAKEVPDAVFALAGDGPEEARLKAMARQLRVEHRVLFLGRRDDVPDLLAVCDAVVLPSLYEGLPIAILEAMALGRPVIATAVGGTPEAVIDGKTGLLVPPADSQRLSAAIRRVLEDSAFAHRLAMAARVRVETEFSSAAMVDRISSVYEGLLDGR